MDQCAAGRKKVGVGTTYVFPLYLYDGNKRKPNLSEDFIKDVEIRLKLKFIKDGKEESVSLANITSAYA